jgi:UDP-N-acetylglucosamine 4-epimerase
MYNTPFHTQDISNLSFLVTGGAGFIGSNIAEYLLKYNASKVVVLDNLKTGFKKNIEPFLGLPNFEFIEGDICNLDDCKRAISNVQYVIHQAALGSVPRSIQNPIDTNNTNVNGFLNVLIAAKQANVKRVVYASSSSVFGDSKILPKVEENIGNPLSPYAVSKLVNELYAGVFYKIYGLEIIGLRYFNIFGPRQNPQGPYAAAIPLFMKAILNNEPPYIDGDGNQTRDFTFVENAVQANIKACFTSNPQALGQVFNIAVGDRISINNVFNFLKEISGATVKPIYRAERPGDIRDSQADITKAQRLLNYQPSIKFNEGLSITFNWFKKEFASL